jgi:hypothetical protein
MPVLFVSNTERRDRELMTVRFLLHYTNSFSINNSSFLVIKRIALHAIVILESRTRVIERSNEFVSFLIIPIDYSSFPVCKQKEVFLHRLKEVVPNVSKRN